MNRKIYLLLTVLLAWSFNLKAQTAQIESVQANPDTTVSFDIDVAGLPANVGAVSLFIGYDPNVLTFTGSTLVDPEFAGYFINNMVGSNQVGIQWTDPNGANINGTMLSLEFHYSGLGGSCDLTFAPGCEFADIDLNSLVVSYTNGSIGPNAGVATITIDELQSTAGPVSLNVTGDLFAQDAGALTLYIKFDNTVLQFSGYSSTLTALLVSVNNTTGLISVAYSNPAGEDINTQFLTLNFNYDGTGTSELVFTGACEVAYTDLTTPIVSYDNGLVEPLASAYHLTIADGVEYPGNVIGIPITAAGFDPNMMGAVTLFIGFNPAHLDFMGITGGTISGASANLVSSGLIGITWSDAGGALIDGTLLTLNFDYNFGASVITFEGGCEITNNALVLFPTTYHDGSISPVVGGAEISLPTKTGTVGQPIDFPIRAKNFVVDAGAISLFIGYDNAVLTYTGSTGGTLTGYFINNMANSHIGIQWSDLNGLDIDPSNDDILLTLHFIYNGGVSDLTFDAGCEFAQPDLAIIPVAYFDGAVITGSRFAIKAFMEGPFNGTDMNAFLGSFIPLSQPYNVAPWNYLGPEIVPVIPNANIVDWVLLQIRETPGAASTANSGTIVAQQAAFILNDGSIVGLDGSSEVLFPMSFNDNVYVVIYHRNHIGMMSSAAVPMVGDIYTYDFTTAQSQAYSDFQDGQKVLAGGFGMSAGDGDGNGDVDLSDLVDVFVPQFGQPADYFGGDADLNSDVDLTDMVDFIVPNFGAQTQIVP